MLQKKISSIETIFTIRLLLYGQCSTTLQRWSVWPPVVVGNMYVATIWLIKSLISVFICQTVLMNLAQINNSRKSNFIVAVRLVTGSRVHSERFRRSSNLELFNQTVLYVCNSFGKFFIQLKFRIGKFSLRSALQSAFDLS